MGKNIVHDYIDANMMLHGILDNIGTVLVEDEEFRNKFSDEIYKTMFKDKNIAEENKRILLSGLKKEEREVVENKIKNLRERINKNVLDDGKPILSRDPLYDSELILNFDKAVIYLLDHSVLYDISDINVFNAIKYGCKKIYMCDSNEQYRDKDLVNILKDKNIRSYYSLFFIHSNKYSFIKEMKNGYEYDKILEDTNLTPTEIVVGVFTLTKNSLIDLPEDKNKEEMIKSTTINLFFSKDDGLKKVKIGNTVHRKNKRKRGAHPSLGYIASYNDINLIYRNVVEISV